jgi:hypothetical protein
MKKKTYVMPMIDIITINISQSFMYSRPEQPVVDPSDPDVGMSKGNDIWEDEK